MVNNNNNMTKCQANNDGGEDGIWNNETKTHQQSGPHSILRICHKLKIGTMRIAAAAAANTSRTIRSASVTSSTTTSVSRRAWAILLVSGLLMTEYSLQKRYYQHMQRNDNALDVIKQLDSIVVPKSHEYIANLNLATCKFPLFFDKSRFDFKLRDNAYVTPGHWRERNKQYVGKEDAGNVYNAVKGTQHQRYQARQKSHTPMPRLQRNITFVHIGKAGGSTVACNLRAGRKYIKEHCDNIDYAEIDDEMNYDPQQHNGRPYIPESAISRHVNCYTHWRMHLKCFYLQGDHPFKAMTKTGVDRNFGSRRELSSSTTSSSSHHPTSSSSTTASSSSSSNSHHSSHSTSSSKSMNKKPLKEKRGNDFLVNLRSPVDRIASWFVYEHTENHDTVYSDRPYHCGQLVLSSCYQHFEHLTTVGLSFPRPSVNQPLKVGTNLTAAECSHWAWATIQGNMPADYHNAFNYDWYAYRLLHDSHNNESDIFVLRVEHLEQDWTTVDKMLGGDASFPATMANRQNSADIKPLRISNHNTTNVGIQNLCRALCDELQVYKQLLLRAINLEPDDIEASMEALRQQCPEELDINPRVCHYD